MIYLMHSKRALRQCSWPSPSLKRGRKRGLEASHAISPRHHEERSAYQRRGAGTEATASSARGRAQPPPSTTVCRTGSFEPYAVIRIEHNQWKPLKKQNTTLFIADNSCILYEERYNLNSRLTSGSLANSTFTHT